MTYEYICVACKHEWEEEQSIKDKPTETCPLCHKKAKRLISKGGNFILKGGRWASTGYGN